jgi:hypothetical protein
MTDKPKKYIEDDFNTFGSRISLVGNGKFFEENLSDNTQVARNIIAMAQPGWIGLCFVVVCLVLIFFMIYSLVATTAGDSGKLDKTGAAIFWGVGAGVVLIGGIGVLINHNSNVDKHVGPITSIVSSLRPIPGQTNTNNMTNITLPSDYWKEPNPIIRYLNPLSDKDKGSQIQEKIVDVEMENSFFWATIIMIVIGLIYIIIATQLFGTDYPGGKSGNLVFFLIWGVLPTALFVTSLFAQKYSNNNTNKTSKIESLLSSIQRTSSVAYERV